MLDDLELAQVQHVTTSDRRDLVEHKPPGMDGSLLQNLGRRPTALVVHGIASGSDSLAFTEQLDEKFRKGEPLAFTADIVADADIQRVLVDDLAIEEVAGKPQRFEYQFTLRESIEPTTAEDPSLLDSSILAEGQDLVDGLVEGLDIGAEFAAGLSRFLPKLGDFLGRLQSFRTALGE